MQRLRREATILPSDEVFPRLKDLRRQVADARILISEARKLYTGPFWDNSHWVVDGDVVDMEQFWSQKPSVTTKMTFGRAQAMDVRDLPDTLGRFAEMINAMTPTINEEIQMLIGSVQIEDAKTMKRQTEWTVVLAVLAAIYLPMTLVTGIFGMNIREINDDQTRPDKWSAVTAWGVVFSATVLLVPIYAVGRYLVRYWLDKREKLLERQRHLDLEAMKID